MGKIQKALTRAKAESSNASVRRRTSTAVNGSANDAPGLPAQDVPMLAAHATKLPLDIETLETNRVVVGSQPPGPATS